jgi:hypothetical protein
MDALGNSLTSRPTVRSTDGADNGATAGRTLQDQYDAQTIRLREAYKAQRPKNTARAYESKQKEWEDWCARLPGNTDGSRVTEDKLCLFLEQEVVNRESRASGYQARKAKRKEMWKEGERAKKRRKTAVTNEPEVTSGSEDENWDEEALDAQFNETVRYSVVEGYVCAITELYSWQQSQASAGEKTPPLRGAKLRAVLDNVRRDENKVRQENFVDRGLFTIIGGYDVQGLKKAITWCWEMGSKVPGSVESYLRTSAEHLLGLSSFTPLRTYVFIRNSSLGHTTVTRGETCRNLQLADLVVIDLENEGPRPNESAPCMITTMRQGKLNQRGKVEYMGCIRNVDPLLCPLSALAFYFFNRWGKAGAQPFPSFAQPEDYYNLFAFPGSVRTPERPLSYPTQFEWNGKMFRGVGIHSKEKTHSRRKQGARHAELRGVPDSQIRRAGRWSTDALAGVYLSHLPRQFIRAIAGFSQEGKTYFLPRAQVVPDEALSSQIWPEADVWLQRMEAYHPDSPDNEVVRLDLAGSGFLRLLRTLRVILLQDSVILRRKFPDHPLWKESIFNGEEYRRFAARVESSLENVVTPDELTMQKYWPAQEAVAKQRHDAAIAAISEIQASISEIKDLRSEVRSISQRLDRPPAPIRILQGSTEIWIQPTTETASASAAASAAASSQVNVGSVGEVNNGQASSYVPNLPIYRSSRNLPQINR